MAVVYIHPSTCRAADSTMPYGSGTRSNLHFLVTTPRPTMTAKVDGGNTLSFRVFQCCISKIQRRSRSSALWRALSIAASAARPQP